MKKVLLVVSVLVIGLIVAYALFAAQQNLADGTPATESGMPVPGMEGVEETEVNSGMPVPGVEGVEETTVSSGMPVPGLEGVEEMVVEDQQP